MGMTEWMLLAKARISRQFWTILTFQQLYISTTKQFQGKKLCNSFQATSNQNSQNVAKPTSSWDGNKQTHTQTHKQTD